MLDVEALSEMIAGVVAEEVAKSVDPLLARIAELEARPVPEKGEPGEKGEDGVSPAPEAIAEAFAPLAERVIMQTVAKAVSELPPPQPGEKGDPGERGADGLAGTAGKDGRDGRGVKDLLIDRDGNLIATMDDGEMKSLGPIVGRDGRDGTDGAQGAPGFSLDDFDVERCSDGRSIVLKFDRGDTRHEYELTFPTPAYCGVFKEGQEYVVGDMVTFGGSVWHCDKATIAKPGTEDWTLAVKKGRDGKDARG